MIQRIKKKWSKRPWKILLRVKNLMKYITIYRTLVSSWAFARLSTAMAKNTLRRVSGYLCSQENTKGLINTESVFTGPANLQINNKNFGRAIKLPGVNKGNLSWYMRQDTISKESKYNEINGREHSPMHTPLGFNPMVHDCVPVLSS